MNRQTLTIVMAGIDIWAILFVLHHQARSPRDVRVAITSPDAPAQPSLDEPLLIWVTPHGVGLWPDRKHPWPLDALSRQVAARACEGRPVDVRLLCEPSLSLRQWGRVALAISDHAASVSIAPLPPPYSVASAE